MLSDKELKKAYRPVFWGDPDKYYPTDVLRSKGFHRGICKKCDMPFWNQDERREVCGDPNCAPGESFGFIGKTPAKNKLTYVEVWKKFSEMFSKFGYTPIDRYPSVARWNPTMEYTNASIAAFQPFVISGEVSPPANPLILPQFSLRFGDVDNVGLTMSHFTGFVMIGQHMFVPEEEWDQDKAFECLYTWFTEGVGIPSEELTITEDSWAGGGNLGCCMEFFSRGCEIGNQVYMLFEQQPDGEVVDLNLKVLDMGMGQERNAWFSQGTATIYDATYPNVLEKLRSIAGVELDEELMLRFVPHAGRLNVDEVESMELAWKEVSELTKTDVDVLKAEILPHVALYSIAEHARSLLIILHDGGLPSNVGGGYNLRLIARRAFAFIDKYRWNIDLADVCAWHAEDLKEMYPELTERLDNIRKILEVEKNKYEATKQKTAALVERLGKTEITTDKLYELYDSQGIAPMLIKEEAAKHGIVVEIPDDFYGKIAERHDTVVVQKAQGRDKLPLDDVPSTKALYYHDWKKIEFEAEVMKVIGTNVVLDETYFYPTSGGQMHDLGFLSVDGDKYDIIDAYKQGPHVVHVLKDVPAFKEGSKVGCHIHFNRRLQLAQHHTGTHVINAAAKKILGPHINQAGAKKTIEKAHIDITHYDSLRDEEVQAIEDEANRIIELKNPVHKQFYPRDEAEKKFGTDIYQGGAVPGNSLRIVDIVGVDVEACGGTHLDNTEEIEKIKIIKSSKIQDGVVRLTFVAGKAAEEAEAGEGALLSSAAILLACTENQVPGRAEELFTKWKKIKKMKKKGQDIPLEMITLESTAEFEGDALAKTAEILKTQAEHVPKTIKRFLDDIR